MGTRRLSVRGTNRGAGLIMVERQFVDLFLRPFAGSAMVENGRIRCAVPYCGHTRGQRKGQPKLRRGDEWVCSEHWRLVDPATKHMKRRWERKARKLQPTDKLYEFAKRNVDYWWSRCKTEAIERAAGITG